MLSIGELERRCLENGKVLRVKRVAGLGVHAELRPDTARVVKPDEEG